MREWVDLAQQYFAGDLELQEFLDQYQASVDRLFPEILTHLQLTEEDLRLTGEEAGQPGLAVRADHIMGPNDTTPGRERHPPGVPQRIPQWFSSHRLLALLALQTLQPVVPPKRGIRPATPSPMPLTRVQMARWWSPVDGTTRSSRSMPPANELWQFATGGTVYGIGVSADGQRIAVASEDRHVYLLDSSGD